MQTLFKKVQAVEEEAQQLITTAEAAGQAALAKLLANEVPALSDIRSQAEKRGEKIVAERVHQAKHELGSIHEEEKEITKKLEQAFAKNKSSALELAEALFKRDYIGK